MVSTPVLVSSLHMFNKVLILSASAGAGQVRAADALEKAFSQSGAAREIRHIDVLNYTNKVFRHLYSKAYLDMSEPDAGGHGLALFGRAVQGDPGQLRDLTRRRRTLLQNGTEEHNHVVSRDDHPLRSSGWTRLPKCVVSIRSVLRFISHLRLEIFSTTDETFSA